MYSYRNIKFWNKTKLFKLRKEICLNSVYISDYENSFNINPVKVCTFFDGFLSYCEELIKEETGENNIPIETIFELDNKENLWNWFCCFEYCPFDN